MAQAWAVKRDGPPPSPFSVIGFKETYKRPKSATVNRQKKENKKAVRPQSASHAYITKRIPTSANARFIPSREGLSACGLRIKTRRTPKHAPPQYGAIGFAAGIGLKETNEKYQQDEEDNPALRYQTLMRSRSEPVLQRYTKQKVNSKYKGKAKITQTANTHKTKSQASARTPHKTAQTCKSSSASSASSSTSGAIKKKKNKSSSQQRKMRMRTLAPSSLAHGYTGGGESFAYGAYYPSTVDLAKGKFYSREGEPNNEGLGQAGLGGGTAMTHVGGAKTRAMSGNFCVMANKQGTVGHLVSPAALGYPEIWRERGRHGSSNADWTGPRA